MRPGSRIIMGLLMLLFTEELCAQNSPPRFQASTTYSVGSAPRSVVAGDFNGDGRTDLVVVKHPGGTATDTIQVLLANEDGSFSVVPVVPGSANLSAVATGDFNGDGNLDIVVTDDSLNLATVLLGNRDGTFLAAGTCATDLAPVAIVVGDFNGDGNLDIAVANQGDGSSPGTVSVCLGNGDGTLGAKQSYRAAAPGFQSDPVGIAVADFNGDSNLDFAVALHSNAYSIILGNGDGTFQAPSTHFLFNTPNPNAIAAGDLNGDGVADLIVATSSVQVLLGNGDATFQDPVGYSVGVRPSGIVIADLNGDGQPDLVVANQFSNNLSVLLNTGAGAFAQPVHYAAEYNPGPIAIGDFKGNSILDVAVVNVGIEPVFRGSLTVAMGNGDGTLKAGRSYLANTRGGLSSLGKFVSGNISGAGLLDVAVLAGDGSVHVLLQNSDFTYQSAFAVSPGIAAEDVVLADVNNDGKLDLVLVGFNGYAVLLGNGDGTFQAPAVQPLPFGSFRGLTLADLNNDGILDLVITNYTGNANDLGVLLGNGDGTFQSAVTYSVPDLPRSVLVADFNLDGAPDIAIATFGGGSPFDPGTAAVLLGKGDGTFQAAQFYPTGVGSVDLAAVDLSGDGFPDIVVVNGGNGTAANGSLSVLVNNADGTFLPAVQYTTGTTLDHIAVGDFNNDGVNDVAITSFATNSLYLFENTADGTGTLKSAPGKYAAGTSPGAIAAGPFSGSGALDVAVANSSGSTITLLLNISGFQITNNAKR